MGKVRARKKKAEHKETATNQEIKTEYNTNQKETGNPGNTQQQAQHRVPPDRSRIKNRMQGQSMLDNLHSRSNRNLPRENEKDGQG